MKKIKKRKVNFMIHCKQRSQKTPQHDLLLLMGDLNAKVGKHGEGNESAMGCEGTGERNEN